MLAGFEVSTLSTLSVESVGLEMMNDSECLELECGAKVGVGLSSFSDGGERLVPATRRR